MIEWWMCNYVFLKGSRLLNSYVEVYKLYKFEYEIKYNRKKRIKMVYIEYEIKFIFLKKE